MALIVVIRGPDSVLINSLYYVGVLLYWAGKGPFNLASRYMRNLHFPQIQK